MDRTFLLERIAVTKSLIVAYESAVLALASANGIESYTLDTGQGRQTVTRADVSRLSATLDGLYNRLSVLQTRLDGSGVTRGVPAW